MSINTLPALFISHGSPMLALEPNQVGAALERISHNLPKPRAIVVMSAHWEDSSLEVSIHPRPKTWHDFRGFPEPLYQLQYPASGEPALAEEIISKFQDVGFDAHANAVRPRDHGVWIPLLYMYPEADIPIVQISLPRTFSARQLFQLGETLSYLRQQQILLIGSGSITHNLATLNWHADVDDIPVWASEFRNTVAHLLQTGDFEAVLDWKNLPYIADNHPTIEHLAPLFFAMGAGLRMSVVHSSFSMGSLGMDIYRFD